MEKQALEEQVKREQDIAREESVGKSVEKQALEEQVKREQDIARQREDLEELHHQYRSRLFDEDDLQDLKESESKGLETGKIPANNWAQKVIQCHCLSRMCGINLSVLIPAAVRDCMRVGKWF